MTASLSHEGPWYRGPAFLMTVALVAFYVSSSFTDDPGVPMTMMNALATAVVLLGLRAFTRSRRAFRVGVGLTVAFVVASAVAQNTSRDFDERANTLFVLLFFALMLLAMAKVVFQAEDITVDKIFAAACVYMLLGICFGLVFLVIEQTYPGSFTLSSSDASNLPGALVHFSFTTLTTVGYGSISPVSSVARSLSDMEAVVAQLYLAIVVARLVSLQLTQGRVEGD